MTACLRKHAELVAGCPSCERMAADPAYRQAVEAIPRGGAVVSRPGQNVPAGQTPAGGPGTELRQLLAELGVSAALVGTECGTCSDYAATMDRLKIDGCRARLHEIAGRLKDQAIKQKARFRDSPVRWAGVAARALKLGLVLNPTNPYLGLVVECIRRAEAAAEPTKPAADIPGPSSEGSSPSHESEGGPT